MNVHQDIKIKEYINPECNNHGECDRSYLCGLIFRVKKGRTMPLLVMENSHSNWQKWNMVLAELGQTNLTTELVSIRT